MCGLKDGFLRKFLKENFDDECIVKIKDFFKTRQFPIEGKVYLLSLIAYLGNSKEGDLGEVFRFFGFLWNTTWRYNPIYKRANLALRDTHKKDIITRREICFFNEICKLADVPPLTLGRIKSLWGEDFKSLPDTVRNKDLNIPKVKKERKKIVWSWGNLNCSPEEKLLKSIYD